MTMLGIDLGTGSVKAAVLDDDGTVLSKASRPYAVSAPRPGWAESDPAEWLAATLDVVGQVLDATGEAPASVGFSGQMHGVVLVDEQGAPLRPAVLWADSRSADETARMGRDLPGELMSRLGSRAVAGFAATSLAWLRSHEPDVLDRAAAVLQPKDWLRVALGGAVATEPSDASGTLLFDVAAGQWSADAVAWAGVDPAVLPAVQPSESSAGTVRIHGREIPAAVGGADTACVVVGLGLSSGEGFTAVGSGSQTVRLMDSPLLDATLRTHTFCVAGPPRAGWYRIGAVQSAGLTLTAAVAWFGATVEEAAAALAAGVQSDDPVFVPYLSGERTPFMTPSLRGSWHGLSLATDRAAMLRSVLEGVAQAVALGVDAVQASGEPLRSPVPLVGGGTHDPAFRQLLADATGLALAVAEAPDAAVVGAALLGAGRVANPVRVPLAAPVEPRPEAAALLRERRGRMVAEVMADLEPAQEDS